MSSSTKRTVILCVILAVAAVTMAVVYFAAKPATQEGAKAVTVEVITGDDSGEVFTLNTDSEYLGQALLEYGLIEGETSDFGMFITSVNGIEADSSAEEWWCVTKGGEDVYTGVDLTPIEDGDVFELTLMKGF